MLLTRFSLDTMMCLSSIVWLCASCGHYYGWLTWWKIPARFVFTYYWVSYCQLWKNIMFCTRRMSFHFSYDLGVLKYSHGCIWKDKYPVMSYPMDICMYVDLWLYIWCTSWLGMTIWYFFSGVIVFSHLVGVGFLLMGILSYLGSGHPQSHMECWW